MMNENEKKELNTPEENNSTTPQNEETTQEETQNTTNTTSEENPLDLMREAEKKTPETTDQEVEEPVMEDTSDSDDDLIDQSDLETLRQETENTQKEDEDEKEEETEPEVEDYSELSKEELVSKSALLAAQATNSAEKPNFRHIDDAISKIRERVDELNKAEREEARQKYEAAADSAEEKEGFSFQQDKFTDTFYENYKAIKEAKRNFYQRLEAEKQENLKKKQAFIEELRKLTDTAQQSGLTRRGEFDRVKSIQQDWKKIGGVPIQEADELYRNYKALLDLFYNQKSQERELLALDRERNLEGKKKLVERAEELSEQENINEAVSELNRLHQEYKRIGPVPRAEREPLWQRFKEASDKIYDRRRAYAEEFKAQLQENMKLKQDLCIKVEEFVGFDSDRIRDWNEKTGEIVAIQKEWEAIGPAPREVSKSINKQFWDNFKQFFANKGKFFEKLDAKRAENLEQKQELVKKAQELKESTDWEKSARALKDLQREWKEIGPVPEKQRDSVYKEFKEAADYFFERRRNRFKEQDQEQEANLEKKQAIVKEIEELSNSKSNDLEKIQQLHLDFHKIGFVPRKAMRSIQDELTSATDKFLNEAGLSEEQQQEFRFKTQAKAVKQNPKMAGQFKHSEKRMERRITDLQNDINLWKTNIEFFAKSKTADKLRDEFDVKIKKAESEIAQIKKQIKALNTVSKQEKAPSTESTEG